MGGVVVNHHPGLFLLKAQLETPVFTVSGGFWEPMKTEFSSSMEKMILNPRCREDARNWSLFAARVILGDA